MKVTAIISDSLIEEVKYYSNGKNITESMTIALKEWLELQHLNDLNKQIENGPLEFSKRASEIRKNNRL